MLLKTNTVFLTIISVVVSGCNSPGPTADKTNIPEIKIEIPRINSNSTVESETGVEKRKPAPGKANLQGKVLYNELPAANIEVKLCEKFSTILGLSCEGKTFKAKTDASGEYLVADVPPMIYEGLTVRVFNTKMFIYLESGILNSASYPLEPDKTFFAPTTNLFKSDLRITSPKNHSTVDAGSVEFKWDAYADAAYYMVRLDTKEYKAGMDKYQNIRTNETSFRPDQPLASDSYKLTVTAYNANGVKLAETDGEFGFYVKSTGPVPDNK